MEFQIKHSFFFKGTFIYSLNNKVQRYQFLSFSLTKWIKSAFFALVANFSKKKHFDFMGINGLMRIRDLSHSFHLRP